MRITYIKRQTPNATEATTGQIILKIISDAINEFQFLVL